jgi:hypothetical protein
MLDRSGAISPELRVEWQCLRNSATVKSIMKRKARNEKICKPERAVRPKTLVDMEPRAAMSDWF